MPKPGQQLSTFQRSPGRFVRQQVRRLVSSIADSPVRWLPEPIPGQLRKLKQLYVQAGFPVSALQ